MRSHVQVVVDSGLDVFAHNIETVEVLLASALDEDTFDPLQCAVDRMATHAQKHVLGHAISK